MTPGTQWALASLLVVLLVTVAVARWWSDDKALELELLALLLAIALVATIVGEK